MQQLTVSYSVSSSIPGVFLRSFTAAASFKRASCKVPQTKFYKINKYFENILGRAIYSYLGE